MSCNTKASTTGNMIELATYTAAKTANVNKLPRKNVCGLDGSGISTLSTACVGKAPGSGAPASRLGDEGDSCGNIEGETTAFLHPPRKMSWRSPNPAGSPNSVLVSGTRFAASDGLVQGLGSSFVDGRHQIKSSRLLDHMPGSGDAVQLALLDLVMQLGRLLIDIDQTIILARKYDRRHVEFAVGLRGSRCSRNHQRRFNRAGLEL